MLLEAERVSVPKGTLPRPKWWWTTACSEATQVYREAHRHLARHPNDEDAMRDHQLAKDNQKIVLEEAKTTSWRQFTAALDPRTPSSKIWPVIRSLDGQANKPLPDSTIQDPAGRKAVSHEEKADLAVKTYAATSRINIPRVDSKAAKSTIRQHLRATPEAEGDELGRDFTMTELQSALRRGGGRAPGPDGVHFSC